jgi:hypothetical protein
MTMYKVWDSFERLTIRHVGDLEMGMLTKVILGTSLTIFTNLAMGIDIQRFPIAGMGAIVACSGETWTAESGEVQFLSREHVDGNGKVHLTYRLQLINVWGMTEFGNVYRGVGNGSTPYDWTSVMLPEYPVTEDTAPIVLRHNISSRLVPVRGSDGVPSFAITRVKITINANGAKVVDTELHEIRCPGAKK